MNNSIDLIATSKSAITTPFTKNLTEERIVTKSFTGRFRNLRISLAGILALIFFSTSWINWNGHQAVLWDLQTRRFYIFGATFLPQDLLLLTILLMISAVALLATNVVVGRAWCGYTCPQSTWAWAFMWVEKITEGDRNQRIKLNSEPWSARKLFKRTLKHSLWLLMSVATGLAFIGYFFPVRELFMSMITADIFNAPGFWVASFAVFTYVNAGWLREKVCLHMCPYSRLQSVVFDKHTLVVTYDSARGENRGSRKKEIDLKAAGLGDCIDCYQCVHVCPTGIDIRNGLQMDCIGCGACIDACDSIMGKMNYPKGLIRYSSEYEQKNVFGQHETGTIGAEQKRNVEKKIESRKILRPIVLAYAAVLLAMFTMLGFTLTDRELISLAVAKDRGLYRVDSAGKITNVYVVKVTNKTQEPQTYEIALDSNLGVEELSLKRTHTLLLAPGEILSVPVAVVAKQQSHNSGLILFSFVVRDIDDAASVVRAKTSFIFPAETRVHE